MSFLFLGLIQSTACSTTCFYSTWQIYAVRPAFIQPDKYMIQSTACNTTCFYPTWQIYGTKHRLQYDLLLHKLTNVWSVKLWWVCVFFLVLFYQKKLSSSNNANQKSSWLYRFFFGLPLSLYIMKAWMMTTLMRKCSRYFHSVCLCCTMIVIDKKVTLPKMGLLICNWLGSANDPVDLPVLEFSWNRGTFLQRREVCDLHSHRSCIHPDSRRQILSVNIFLNSALIYLTEYHS